MIALGPAYKPVNTLIINRRAAHEGMDFEGLDLHEIQTAKDEIELFSKVIALFKLHDPDIVVSWEAERMGIGYLCKRAQHGIGFKLTDLIDRTSQTFTSFNESFYRRKYF